MAQSEDLDAFPVKSGSRPLIRLGEEDSISGWDTVSTSQYKKDIQTPAYPYAEHMFALTVTFKATTTLQTPWQMTSDEAATKNEPRKQAFKKPQNILTQ